MPWKVVATAVLSLVVLVPQLAAADALPIYKAKCSGCHAADGSGSTTIGKTLKVPDLRSEKTQKTSDADLIKVVTSGKGKMPAYKGKLTADEIKCLVTYIQETMKPKS